MGFPSWLRNWTSNRAPQVRSQRRSAPRRFRPQLDALEDRCVPSTLTVTNNLDGSVGSLRYEIGAAQSGDTIVFAKSVSGTISLGGSELLIDKNLDIEGPGANHLAISGGRLSRVFEVAAGVQVTLSGLTVENGDGRSSIFGDPDPNDGKGGGIVNWGMLTISGCTVSGNDDNTGALASNDLGGGIYNAGTLTVSGSVIKGNTAVYGGGIYNDSAGMLTILNSTVTGNQAWDVYNLGTWSQQGSKIGTVGP
jgi:hypothetical protein